MIKFLFSLYYKQKVFFHYKTIVKETGEVLDDSKKLNEKRPMELIIGKKFKLETWEKALKTMWLNEVAKFSVVKELLYDYPVVAKQLREFYASLHKKEHHGHDHGHSHEDKSKSQRGHCCGYNLIEHGVGYADLDDLLKNPKPLDFIFELVRVERPGEYKKDSWSLNEEERIKIIPILKEEGNVLFKEKNYKEACDKYQEALGYLEQQLLREKPNDEDWNKINETKLPILFNFSLCKFHLNEFYSCIEHTTSILEYQPSNVKAMYRRAKAHASVGNLDEARADFKKCQEIDPGLAKDIAAQLSYVDQLEMKYKREQKEKLSKMFA